MIFILLLLSCVGTTLLDAWVFLVLWDTYVPTLTDITYTPPFMLVVGALLMAEVFRGTDIVYASTPEENFRENHRVATIASHVIKSLIILGIGLLLGEFI